MSLCERALKRMEALAAAYAQGDTPWGPDRDQELMIKSDGAVRLVMGGTDEPSK